MKELCLILFLLSPLVFTYDTDAIDKTAELLRKGDAHELAMGFSTSIDLTLKGTENTYSATQAESVLADFFKQNQPRTVKILHRVASNPNYRFGVIILTTSNGAYRLSFSLKNVKGRFEMTELRIEAEKTN